MDTSIKKQWVDALRSGEYKQGQHALRRGDEFCCLGVLCDLAAKAGVVVAVERDDLVAYDDATGFLPESVMAWAGLSHCSPTVKRAGKTRTLTTLNDTFVPFNQIADLIEEQL